MLKYKFLITQNENEFFTDVVDLNIKSSGYFKLFVN